MEKLPKMQNPRSRTDATHTSTLRLVWPAFVFRMVTKANPVSAAGTDDLLTTELVAAEHVAITASKGPHAPLIAEHMVLLMLSLTRHIPALIKEQ